MLFEAFDRAFRAVFGCCAALFGRQILMKLYDGGRAPNPRRTRIFLAEKGISLPIEQVDIMAKQHKTPEYTAINPLQRIPSLVLDDGTVIAELIAICRYFEALRPDPPLFGVGAKEIAEVEMWNRRCEMNFMFCVASVFRHLHPSMKELEVPQLPEWAEANKPRVAWFLELLDRELGAPRIHRRRPLFCRRHHRVGDRRLHEAGASSPSLTRLATSSAGTRRFRQGRARPRDASDHHRLRRRLRFRRAEQHLLPS